jgi:hypothetical protein
MRLVYDMWVVGESERTQRFDMGRSQGDEYICYNQ